MTQTVSGAKKAAAIKKAKYGDDYFKELGRKGGKAGTMSGFYGRPKAAAEAGRKGAKVRWTKVNNKKGQK